MVNARVTVAGPVRTPHRFGLFSAVPVVDVDGHELMGVQWEPPTCARPKVLPDSSCCPTVKEFEPPAPVQDATPFTVMGSWSCTLLGNNMADAVRRARQHLEAGEQHAVEYEVWTGEAGSGPRFADPTTPNLGTVHCAADLLAVLEEYASRNYVGQPLLHVPRSVLPYFGADGLTTVVGGNRLETNYGLPIVAGAGYSEANTGPDGAPAPAGSYWVYLTGAMKVWRGSIVEPPNPEAGFSRCNNEFVALAERIYLVGWDCFTVAVLFEPCCPCGAPELTPPPPPAPGPGGASTEETP